MESSKREGSAQSVDTTADRLLTSFCQRGVGGDNIVTIVIIKLLVTTARELKKYSSQFQSSWLSAQNFGEGQRTSRITGTGTSLALIMGFEGGT